MRGLAAGRREQGDPHFTGVRVARLDLDACDLPHLTVPRFPGRELLRRPEGLFDRGCRPSRDADDDERRARLLARGRAGTREERRGLVAAAVALVLVVVVMAVAVLLPMSPWRNEDGGYLPESPLLDSIVFVVFTFFAVGGFVYGKVARTIDGMGDVPRLMGAAVKDMIPFIVLAFILGQLIALFDWSGVGSGIAARRDRCTYALDAALGVHERAVLLERRRGRQKYGPDLACGLVQE